MRHFYIAAAWEAASFEWKLAKKDKKEVWAAVAALHLANHSPAD
jgi:hypothetical protein